MTLSAGAELVRRALPPRRADSHKGDYGSVLLVCGSRGLTGAAYLAASAAVRGGAGLVSLAVPQSVYPILAVKTASAMAFPAPENDLGCLSGAALPLLAQKAEGADALVLGCGLGRAPDTFELVRRLAETVRIPVVLDADGINAFAGHIHELCGRGFVLTPHEGELARLGLRRAPGESRSSAAVRMAAELGCLLVFKGSGTAVAAPDGRLFVNDTGNPGMSRGGSGDLLAGLTGAFLAQGADPFTAAAAAVHVHGLAGDLARDRLGEIGMAPEDMLAALPEAIRSCRGI